MANPGSEQEKVDPTWAEATNDGVELRDTSKADHSNEPSLATHDSSAPRTSTQASALASLNATAPPNNDVEAKGDEAAQEDWKPGKSERLIMMSLAFISLVVALDATILVTVLPEIAEQLNGTSTEAFWAGASYLLTSAVVQPVIASISSILGRQQLLLFSLLCFTVGSILCAVAQNFTVLLVGRCIKGIGGGGITTITQVIFCDIVPLRQRPKNFAAVLLAYAIGTIIGPVVGGAIADNTTWRWCFYLNLPICGIGFVVAGLFVRLNAVAKLTLGEKLRRIDWLGVSLFMGSVTSFLVGVSWGGVQHPWDSAATLAPIIVGLAGLVAFAGWQGYRKEHTMLPLVIFSNWSAIAAFYCAMINGLVLYAALYYYPVYVMSSREKSPTATGVDLLPTAVLFLPGSILVANLTTRLGRFRWAIWGGWAITTIACGLFILFDLEVKQAVNHVVMAILGIGLGMLLTSINIGIQAISKPENTPMAASMYGFFRSLGMPLGVSLSGTIFQNAMANKLSDLGLDTAIARNSEQYLLILRDMADSAEKTAIKESYMKGFQVVFITTTAISASALVASLAIRKFSMDRILLAQFTVKK